MKIEQLPSGSYRVRKYANGKRHTVIFDHKPKESEIIQALAEKIGAETPNLPQIGSIDEYVAKYMAKCEKRKLSPSSLRGYDSIIRNTPDWFLLMPIKDVTAKKVQRLIDEYSETHSPKSTRLLWSFYHSVLALYAPDMILKVDLPPLEKKAEYEPSTRDIERILEYSKNTRYHIPLQLAVLGLRRGETCALTLDDLGEDNVLSITKDLVVDRNNKITVKDTPKTATSNRRIPIPKALADEIRAQGYIFHGNPHTINEFLHKAQNSLSIPKFKLHMLRHFSCAYLHQQGFTDSQILAWGGWEENSDVMKRVYRYNLDPEKAMSTMVERFSALVDG